MRVMISGDLSRLNSSFANRWPIIIFLTLMSSSSFYNNYNKTNQMLTQISPNHYANYQKKIRDRNWSRIFDVSALKVDKMIKIAP
ncbi:hypothetical protein EAI73_01835 [Leuconostoc lactis]|nr:hypothetical protein EAI73_01835 [Leuconostoc lactis]